MDGIVCGGGMDDGPEDVLGGLKAASELSWTATHRFMYLIGDNPCHGTVYHNDRHSGHKKGHKDRYPKVEDEPKGLKAEEILAVIYDKNLHFSFCKVTSYTDIMITKFNGIFRGIIAAQPKELPGTGSSTSSESIDSAAKASEDYIKTLIVKDVNLIEIIVGTTLHSLTSSSLTASACTDSGKHVRMKDYVLNPTKPMSWPEKVIEAIEYPLRVPESVQEIVTAISTNSQLLCIDNYPRVCQYTMKLQECPFGLGAMKASFFGLLTDLAVPDESVLHVFKESKAEHVSKLTRREYEKFLLCHSVSTFLADLFTIQKPKQYPNVCFAEASLMELTSEHTTDSSEIFMIKEEYINAPYEKYNSNAGYVSSSPSVVWLTDHGVVQAFSHWTYQVTNGMLMVVDCQGGYDAKSRRFILTDPAIHCKNPLMFGKTNMQTKGMQNFFKSHKCNACCKEMGLFNPY
ncbi:hypothetical protein EON65_13545 [archaeon]|nr:MAG: hypothetical protein EON65_13545 [archaeon]